MILRGGSCHHILHPRMAPHLVGLVEEAAPAPLEQELDVLINAAARKLSGQIISVFTNTYTHTHTYTCKDQDQDMTKK